MSCGKTDFDITDYGAKPGEDIGPAWRAAIADAEQHPAAV